MKRKLISFTNHTPSLLEEIHPTKNKKIDLKKISYGSNKKIWWKGKCGHIWEASVKNRVNGAGCPICAGRFVVKGKNDFASKYPELAKEWNDSRFIPSEVTPKSNLNILWKCSVCEYCWKARIADRTEGHGCPCCSGQRTVCGINDLKTLFPDIAEEWSKDNVLKLENISSKSREKVYWECKVCGHKWEMVINTRVSGSGCPNCKRKEHLLFKERMTSIQRIKKKLNKRFDLESFVFYANALDCEVVLDSDIVGIPIQIYLPAINTAIEFYRSSKGMYEVRRWENAKNDLCLKAGIRMIRILDMETEEFQNCICITRENKTMETLDLVLEIVFQMIGMNPEIDTKKDFQRILQSFRKREEGG